MSTYEVKDHREWKPGDDVRMPLERGAVITGEAYVSKTGALCVGDRIIRFADGIATETAVTVTRTVEDIPEPTGLGAVVRFAGYDITAVRAERDRKPWRTVENDEIAPTWSTWQGLLNDFGPAVALLAPGVQDGAR